MSKKYLGYTNNNSRVFVTENSHAAAHIADNQGLWTLIPEILESEVVEGTNVYFDKDMGRVVGTCDMVETSDHDEVVYAKRLNRNNYARFVLYRAREETSFVTLALNQAETGDYELKSVWFGRKVPQFPGDHDATDESGPFWRNHALVWGSQAVQDEKVTKAWPWS